MTVTNTLAFYVMAKIIAVKRFRSIGPSIVFAGKAGARRSGAS
jgi:hypothetical protein